MAKTSAKEKNYCLLNSTEICFQNKANYDSQELKQVISGSELSVLHASIAGRGNRKYTGQIKSLINAKRN